MIVVHTFKPFGLQFGIYTKHFNCTLFAFTIGKIVKVEDLSSWTFGLGWNLQGVETYQLFKRF